MHLSRTRFMRCGAHCRRPQSMESFFSAWILKLKLPLPTERTEKLAGDIRGPMCDCMFGRNQIIKSANEHSENNTCLYFCDSDMRRIIRKNTTINITRSHTLHPMRWKVCGCSTCHHGRVDTTQRIIRIHRAVQPRKVRNKCGAPSSHVAEKRLAG